ncbi:hypothetical protein KR018_009806, partial [Drosophila ironensis]
LSNCVFFFISQNASVNFNQVQVKKMTVPSQEATTKRAALGDLQNRAVNRQIGAKDAAQKDAKDLKLTNALRNGKARVDTHWKKPPLGSSSINANANAVAPAKNEGGVAAFLRSNSIRNPPANRPLAEVVTKAKPSAASDNGEAALKREDSNLSKRSLSKLRAALAKPVLGVSGITRHAVTAGAVRKEAAGPEPKKETASRIKPPSSVSAAVPSVAAVAMAMPTSMSLSSKRLAGIEDIDENDKENLVLVSEYVNDIYDYLYEVEQQQPIHKDHLAGQKEVTHKMRSVLIDWINEVHLQFQLAPETFQLAVSIIDRYLQVVKDTKRTHLQLVGVTALFIATKYEELFPPAISDFSYITDNAYTARQIRQMELQIFKAIDCNLSRPLPIQFLRRFSKAAGAEDPHHIMSKYFIELSCVDYELASYRPSEIAAASLFLSLHLINGNYRAATGFSDRHWTPTLTYYSRYTAAHLRPIARMIAKLARDAPQAKLKAIYNKFQKITMKPELSGALLESIITPRVQRK